MNHTDTPAYGLWSLVILNSAVFIIFALSYFKPKTKTDWRTFGTFSAFIIALFVEMYGFPLTIYFMSGWLSSHYPQLNLYTHDSGHLLHTLLGLKGDSHFDVLHILSSVFIFGGFILLAKSWKILHQAQINHEVARTGPYARVRHPQYIAFVLIMFGFLIQWPTMITVIMFPILLLTYLRLAKKEELDSMREFGDAYRYYMAETPAFIPHLSRKESHQK